MQLHACIATCKYMRVHNVYIINKVCNMYCTNIQATVWRETLVVGKFGELSAKLPRANGIWQIVVWRACNEIFGPGT